MKRITFREQDYIKQMQNIVEPFLEKKQKIFHPEPYPGCFLYVAGYHAENPKGILLLSHGFTETVEKYKEVIYYLLKAGYHVCAFEHSGHGRSYRLTNDLSRVHTDSYQRYVHDLLFLARLCKESCPELPLFLYGHSMGGGIAAAAAASADGLFDKVILSSPMIRPCTGQLPWTVISLISSFMCLSSQADTYVAGHHPYTGKECFEKSCSTSPARFAYYQEKRHEEPLFQTNGASYGWLHEAVRLNRYLQHYAWKQISVPLLAIQAGKDTVVCNRQLQLFLHKLHHQNCRMHFINIANSKHEIYGSRGKALEIYWQKILRFLDE